MTAAEIGHRMREQLRRRADRRCVFSPPAHGAEGPLPVFPGLAQSVMACSDALKAEIAQGARKILDGEFEALGVAWPRRDTADLFPRDLWRLDPITGGLWPGANRASVDIPYRHQTEFGSVKYVWELSRLQFLQPLAASYLLTGDLRALSAVEAAIDSWGEANPPFRGVNWNSGIEIGLRAASLIFAASVCGEALSERAKLNIRAILSASAHWLHRYPSLFSSANNHLVAEAMALFLIGALAPELAPTAAADEARAVLEREALLQIFPDGIGAEQSPTYAGLTLEAILTAALLGRRLGQPFSFALNDRLAAFGEAMSWFCGPDGRTVSIGDNDEGMVWRTFARHEQAYPASVAAAVAGYLERQPFCVRPEPELRDAIFSSPDGMAASPSGKRIFADGGYTVVRERRAGRDVHLIVDHGPLGYLSLAAHGHADAGAFVLCLDGEPVIVDPGTFMYHAQNEWRSWFRGTRSHNTLSVAYADQSVIAGPFLWSHKAAARLDRATQDDEGWSLEMSHDGYRRQFGVTHHRSISSTTDGLTVCDRLGPPNQALRVEAVLQFAPGLRVDPEGSSWVVQLRSGRFLTVCFDTPGHAEVRQGGEAYDGGWVSSRFGHKEPAPRLSWEGVIPKAGLRTRLFFRSARPD